MQQAMAMETQKNIMDNFGQLNQPVQQGSAISDLNEQMAMAQGGM